MSRLAVRQSSHPFGNHCRLILADNRRIFDFNRPTADRCVPRQCVNKAAVERDLHVSEPFLIIDSSGLNVRLKKPKAEKSDLNLLVSGALKRWVKQQFHQYREAVGRFIAQEFYQFVAILAGPRKPVGKNIHRCTGHGDGLVARGARRGRKVTAPSTLPFQSRRPEFLAKP